MIKKCWQSLFVNWSSYFVQNFIRHDTYNTKGHYLILTIIYFFFMYRILLLGQLLGDWRSAVIRHVSNCQGNDRQFLIHGEEIWFHTQWWQNLLPYEKPATSITSDGTLFFLILSLNSFIFLRQKEYFHIIKMCYLCKFKYYLNCRH